MQMIEQEVLKLTKSQKLVIGRLCDGNSAFELAMMLIEYMPEEVFNEILVDTIKDMDHNMKAFDSVLADSYRTVVNSSWGV